MRRKAFLLLAILSLSVSAASAQSGSTRLLYEVRVDPENLDGWFVSLTVVNPGAPRLEFSIPDWAPGAYRLMGNARRIEQVEAAADGDRKIEPRYDGRLTWSLDCGDAREVRVSWLSRHSATIRGASRSRNNRSYLTATGGLIDGPPTFFYVRGRKDLRAQVRFRLPEGWQVATGLRATPDPMVFTAADYDVLIDCPTLVGKFHSFPFEVGGVPHRIVFDNGDRPIPFDAAAVVDVARRICEAQTRLMDDIPYDHFTFIYVNGGGGGLEHLNSTTIGVSEARLKADPAASKDVTAHEYFHVWNVKRIRPAILGPFDYDVPQRTKNLWISEGITEYYTEVSLARAGLVTEEQFRSRMAAAIRNFDQNEAHLTISPEESSWTVWDGGGGGISYYLQGQLLGWLLDILIRDFTANERSLDDVFRILSRQSTAPRGFTSEDFIWIVNSVAGRDLGFFFRAHVSGAREIPWEKWLALAGLYLVQVREAKLRPGIVAEDAGGKVLVRFREAGFLHRGGLENGDQILELNGAPATAAAAFNEAFGGLRQGDRAALRIRRGDEELLIDTLLEPVPDLPQNAFLRDGALRVGIRLRSPAERAGLRAGDEILAVNGRPVRDPEQYREVVAGLKAGEAVAFTVFRDNAETRVEFSADPVATIDYRLEPRPDATDKARRIHEAIVRPPAPR